MAYIQTRAIAAIGISITAKEYVKSQLEAKDPIQWALNIAPYIIKFEGEEAYFFSKDYVQTETYAHINELAAKLNLHNSLELVGLFDNFFPLLTKECRQDYQIEMRVGMTKQLMD